MSTWNTKLGAAAVVLFILSALTYWNSVARADRFERGQKLLSNLNPDEVATITLRTKSDDGEGDETTTLVRSGERFVVREVDGYRASNSEVNRLLRDLLDISLERRVGAGESLEAELGIEPLGRDGVEVALANAAGEEMVRLRVGNRTEDGGGSFVARLDGEDRTVFATASAINLDGSRRRYLQREIIDVPSADVVRVQGPDFELRRSGDGPLELRRGKGNSSEISKLASFLNRLQFDEVFLADDPEVVDLGFEEQFAFDLKDRSGYRLSVAEDPEGRKLIRIIGTFDVDRIEVSREESDEELEEKADILKRADEINQFNAYHGSWVYRLESFDGDKLDLRRADLRAP